LFAAGSAGLGRPKPAKLEVDKVTAIDLITVGGASSFCPNGGAVQFKVVATLEGGKKLTTPERGESIEGKLEFSAFEWSTDIGAVGESGVLRLPGDPFAVVDRTVKVTARVAGKPKISSEVELTPRFDCGGMAGFSGQSGESGRSGAAGRQGRRGESGNSSKQATDGEGGQDGQDASDGGNGGPGPDIEVALALVKTQMHGELVLVRVTPMGAASPAAYWLIDPQGEPFTVTATGGSGGHGGSGGSGGSGGFGGSNNIQGGGDGGNGGDGGDGGRGANGGDGGDGGSILVRYDRKRPELRGLVRYSTAGGPGGSPGGGGYGGTAGPGGSSASGQRGTNGRQGVSGQGGQSGGRDGRSGPAARMKADKVQSLFAGEIEAGIDIIK
jgi:hypothetical protein